MCSTKTHMMGRSSHVPTGKTIELLVRVSRVPVPDNRGRPRSPGGTLPVVHHRARVGGGWNNICPVFAPCAVARNRIVWRWPRAFIAKAVFQIDTTRALLERLANDRALRRLCGWESVRAVPSEATFSRAFAGFAEGALPSRLHEALIENTMQEQLVGHVSRDATAIEGREKPTAKPKQPGKPKRKRGRPRKGEERPKEPSRLQRQQQMTLVEMLDDLPHACDVGTKRNAKGYKESWIGYKLHIDAGDGGIPLSCNPDLGLGE